MVLADYDDGWPQVFDGEASRVRVALGELVLLLEHVGSTSVRGLVAKPIIDMVLAVVDSRCEADYLPGLEAAGFVLRVREPGWHEHRMFKGPAADSNLHVFTIGSAEVARMLAFRDRLRADDASRDRYASEKRRLARRSWAFVQHYADAKSEIVEEIIRAARTSDQPSFDSVRGQPPRAPPPNWQSPRERRSRRSARRPGPGRSAPQTWCRNCGLRC